MEIGQVMISTEEYLELRDIKASLEARKAEIEANADKILIQTNMWGVSHSLRFEGKDHVLGMLQKKISYLERQHPKTTLGNRLRFLFTGNLEYEATENLR